MVTFLNYALGILIVVGIPAAATVYCCILAGKADDNGHF